MAVDNNMFGGNMNNMIDTIQRIRPLGYEKIGTDPDVYKIFKICIDGVIVAESTYPGYTTKTYLELNPGCSIELIFNAETVTWYNI